MRFSMSTIHQSLANLKFNLTLPHLNHFAAALGIPEDALEDERATMRKIQICTDETLAAVEEDFQWLIRELLELSPAHALAALEVSSGDRLESLPVEIIASLMRLDGTALRLATMAIVGRRGRGEGPAENLGHTESLELRKARRYIHARVHGANRVRGLTPEAVGQGVDIVDRERQCTSCGALFLRHEAGAGRDIIAVLGASHTTVWRRRRGLDLRSSATRTGIPRWWGAALRIRSRPGRGG
jgi:hypothetical protein